MHKHENDSFLLKVCGLCGGSGISYSITATIHVECSPCQGTGKVLNNAIELLQKRIPKVKQMSNIFVNLYQIDVCSRNGHREQIGTVYTQSFPQDCGPLRRTVSVVLDGTAYDGFISARFRINPQNKSDAFKTLPVRFVPKVGCRDISQKSKNQCFVS